MANLLLGLIIKRYVRVKAKTNPDYDAKLWVKNSYVITKPVKNC